MRITYLKNKKSKTFSGSIYVQFKTMQAAEEALFLDGSYLRGKLIYVKARVFNINIFIVFIFLALPTVWQNINIFKTLLVEEIEDHGC